MKNTSQKAVYLLLFGFSCLNLTIFAEVIKLKNGKIIETKIIERTDKNIKLDVEGIPITYYLDEIESIDGKKIELVPKEKQAIPKSREILKSDLPQEKRNKLADLLEYTWKCWNAQNDNCVIEKAAEMLKIDSTFPPPYLFLGLTYFAKGKMDEAFPYLKEVAEEEEYFIQWNMQEPLSLAYAHLGTIYHFEKDEEKALYFLKKAIELGPTNSWAHFMLGSQYITIGELGAAREEIAKLRELGANDMATALEQGIEEKLRK